jgi:hypothetical protein
MTKSIKNFSITLAKNLYPQTPIVISPHIPRQDNDNNWSVACSCIGNNQNSKREY